MTPLTDSQINEALALGMGWHRGKLMGIWDVWIDDKTNEYECDRIAWKPTESLDQMHLVETRIIELGLW